MANRPGRPHSTDGHTTTFGEYLIQRGVTHAAAAKDLGVSRVFVSLLARGQSFPSADFMYLIEGWSKGAVKMQDWYE